MMDLMKAIGDPEFMAKMSAMPDEIISRLDTIINQNAEILQICKSAPWYNGPTATLDIQRVVDTLQE